MLKVEELGVIRVTYLSEISFCYRPLMTPSAPIVLTASVTANSMALIQAFFVLYMGSLLYCVSIR